MDYKAKYEQWCQDPIFDKETKAELSAIAGDEKEIEDRFYKDLSFGTGGLRRRDRSWNQPDECVYGDQGNAGSG